MKSISGAAISAAVILMVSGCGGTASQITVPSADSTPPTVTMDIFLPNQSTPLTVTSSSPVSPAARKVTAQANDRLTTIARGDDPDGGVQDIQIWATYTCFKAGSQVGPGLAGAPEASNPDSATAGGTAQISRLVSFNFEMQTLRAGCVGVTIDVWAVAKNFHGGSTQTLHAAIVWP